MKKRKWSMVMAAILAAGMVISGCAKSSGGESTGGEASEGESSSEASSGEEDSSTGDVTLVLSRWSGPHADDQKKILKEYEEAAVEMDDIDYGSLKQKQIQSLSSSADYDLVWVHETWLKDYVEKDFLLPLNDLVKENGTDLSLYSDGMIESNTIDGEFYGFPTFAQTYFITYNKEWFEKEGQTVPETPEELVETAKYFKEKGTGIAIPAMQGAAAVDVFSSLLYSYGGDYFDEDGKLDLTSEPMQKAFALWKDLCDNSMTGSLTWHNDQVSQAVREEKAPFGITISGLSYMDIDPEVSLITDKVGYAPIPGEKGNIGVVTYWTWAVAKNSKNPEAAYALAAWLTSTETEKEQCLMNGQITAVKSLAEDSEVVESIPVLPVANEVLASALPQPSTGDSSKILEALQATLSEIGATDIDPAEAAAALQESLGNASK